MSLCKNIAQATETDTDTHCEAALSRYHHNVPRLYTQGSATAPLAPQLDQCTLGGMTLYTAKCCHT